MRTLPFPRCIFIGFRPGRIDMDGAQDFIQTQTMLDGEYKFWQLIAGVRAGNADT